jgi:heavy metal sensor kinase
MRSIRLSLIAYFLGLLVLALGVASWLVYNSADAALRDKEKATEQSINDRFKREVVEEEKQLDKRLLDQAFALPGRVQVTMNWSNLYDPHRQLYGLAALSAMQSPAGPMSALSWLMQVTPSPPAPKPDEKNRFLFPTPFAWEIWRLTVAEVSLTQRAADVPETLPQYYQIDINHWGPPLRSPSLAGLSLPQPDGFGDGQPLHWEADTYELAHGKWVRRIRVKASNVKAQHSHSRPSGMGPGSTRPGGRRPRRFDPPPLFLTIQVAADLSVLEDRKEQLAGQRDVELQALREETVDALARLRVRLLLIAAVTFLATTLGAWALVWLGLWPLKNLSEAVSKVSSRDFHLPVDKELMPAELQPITEKLTGTLEQLKRAFTREKQAAADISHELRTPLAALLTTIELALRRPRTPEKYREMFVDCHLSVKYLHQIVERLLALARLDAGVDRCKPQAVDVAQIAEQCAAVVRPLAEAQGLTLTVSNGPEVKADPGAARTTTDPDKLREVLNNLLHNAIQYNRPNGQIDVRVHRENGHVRVEVADTGIGIPKESRERIFERFYRADPSRNCGDGLHAGLGLAIVKEYIEVMGGHIEVQSQEGEGTVFRVELPVCS